MGVGRFRIVGLGRGAGAREEGGQTFKRLETDRRASCMPFFFQLCEAISAFCAHQKCNLSATGYFNFMLKSIRIYMDRARENFDLYALFKTKSCEISDPFNEINGAFKQSIFFHL